jgi:hypothetical protein
MKEAFTRTGDKVAVEFLGVPAITSKMVTYDVGKRRIHATRIQNVYVPSLRTHCNRKAICCILTGEWYIL